MPSSIDIELNTMDNVTLIGVAPSVSGSTIDTDLTAGTVSQQQYGAHKAPVFWQPDPSHPSASSAHVRATAKSGNMSSSYRELVKALRGKAPGNSTTKRPMHSDYGDRYFMSGQLESGAGTNTTDPAAETLKRTAHTRPRRPRSDPTGQFTQGLTSFESRRSQGSKSNRACVKILASYGLIVSTLGALQYFVDPAALRSGGVGTTRPSSLQGVTSYPPLTSDFPLPTAQWPAPTPLPSQSDYRSQDCQSPGHEATADDEENPKEDPANDCYSWETDC
ncbi:hypothetical protein IAU59_001776 [Kwoniella sp. CBS 9459]